MRSGTVFTVLPPCCDVNTSARGAETAAPVHRTRSAPDSAVRAQRLGCRRRLGHRRRHSAAESAAPSPACRCPTLPRVQPSSAEAAAVRPRRRIRAGAPECPRLSAVLSAVDDSLGKLLLLLLRRGRVVIQEVPAPDRWAENPGSDLENPSLQPSA